MGVHPQDDRWVGVAEPGDDMHLSTGQKQGRRVDMTQIMQPQADGRPRT
jgi:hypothetical protein